MAHLFEEKAKKKLITRIRRIKGQLGSVEKVLLDADEEKCFQLLQTLAAARGALTGLMQDLVESHVREHVMEDAANPQSPSDQAALELVDLLKSYWK